MSDTTTAEHRDASLAWQEGKETDMGSLRPIPAAIGIAAFLALLLLPAPEGLSVAGWRVVAVAALMIIWWITEAVPIAATSLVPLALFPLAGATTTKAAAAPYANPTIFLFMGGFMMATAFLSMWVSNTATAVMMLPIALSVIGLMHDDEHERETAPFALALMLGIAYAASIGGVATLIGTPHNALLAGVIRQTYGYDLGFGRWMLIGVPVAVVMLIVSWLLLTRLSIRLPSTEVAGAHALIRAELQGLGPMSWAEKIVGFVFVLAAALWILRAWLQNFLPGLSDAGIAIGAALVLFLVPAGVGRDRAGLRVALLDWSTAAKLPWGVLILFGGGLSLAAAVAASGLDTWIGGLIGAFAEDMPILALVIVVCAIILLLTEVTSNTATAATFLPLLAALSQNIGQNPLMLTVPAALSASMAFMLPVATPPNAVVFSSGHVSIPQMVRQGGLHNLAALLVISTIGYLSLTTLFGVVAGTIPAWATAVGLR